MKNLPSAARQAQIRERLSAHPGVSVSELARKFDVSEMTVRRDLAALEGKSHIQRTHGGAMLTQRMMLEFDYRARREHNRPLKQAIAAAARKLIQPGQRLILDNGTTTLELASLLKDGQDLTVITPSLAVASELQHAAGVEVILLGGVIRRGSPDLTGPVTEHCLELFAADYAFQGADGIGANGAIYNSDLRLACVDKIMRRVAHKSCVLADHTKIGLTALACSGTLADVDFFITDTATPAAALKRFARLGPRIITAKP
ncbi:DeoR/GlpR family DNA-binding transcription regulator [Opitutus sp. GAS368]|uniref:DeoR/GlpR family DNA-binding transcription regulator n=1 Tax=Opitutus sp. GAS368 TaxID=1882749 RepID=UPI00087A2721|nr:DeoR/GlpR family DNA-binding transcription regulator [Opitutus sp. GAS368]SDS48570.1 transcriptional regulator, DeoR family [Opitutus sp. GAS368]